jgi:hypothetical protein
MLVGVILLGTTSFDIGSRQFLQSSERKTQVLNEATLILDHITKDALRGIGDAANPALFQCSAGELCIKQDTNGDGIRDDSNTTDHVVAYSFNQGTHKVVVQPDINNATTQVLSQRVTTFSFTINDNTADVSVTLLFNPTETQDSFSNPGVTGQTTIEVPGYSLQ